MQAIDLENNSMIVPTTRQSKSLIVARDYQLDAIKAIEKAFSKGIRRSIIALPTGTGKTIIFANLINKRGGRALVLAHRDELIEQAIEKILLVNPTARIGKLKAEINEIDAEIVVASVQTLFRKKRLEQLAKDFNTIVVDEAHHAPAKTYRRILEHLGTFKKKNAPLTLGVTATPERGDGVGLDSVFQQIVYSGDLVDMIAQRYLADLRSCRIQLPIDLDQLQIRRGDFVESAVSQALTEIDAPTHIVKAVSERASGRKTLIFVPSVELAKIVAARFRSAGINSEAIHGKTPLIERRSILARLSSGEIRVVVNCMVLTEGFDEPSVDCVVIARPTLSRSLYVQMVGRGSRLYPGKEDCLIIDLVGASERHDLITLPTLVGLPVSKLEKQTVIQALEKLEKEKRIAEIKAAEQRRHQQQQQRSRERNQAEKERSDANRVAGERRLGEYLRRSAQLKFRWISLPPSLCVLNMGNLGIIILRHMGASWDAMIYNAQARTMASLAKGLTLAYAQGVAEDIARKHSLEFYVDADAPWRKQPASEKQISMLQRSRLPFELNPNLSKGEASDLITIKIALDCLR